MSWRLLVLSACAVMSLTGCGHLERVSGLMAGLTAGTPAHHADGPVPVWREPIHLRASLTEHPPPAMLDVTPVAPYVLDTGDHLRIFVYGQAGLSRLYMIDHAGLISLPLAGTIRARGLTTAALARAIAQRLSLDHVTEPRVTVEVRQNRPFFILGEVNRAGQYPFVNRMTVETAVAVAGGYRPGANAARFRLTRRTDGLVEVLEVPASFAVQPGDTIYVHARSL